LDTLTKQNASLRKQLGIVDDSSPSRTTLPSPTPAQPLLVPPQVDVPNFDGTSDGPKSTGPIFGTDPPSGTSSKKSSNSLPKPSEDMTPPTLEGVPPLPQESSERGASRPVRQLSFAESVGHQADLTHLVINHEKTVCYDSDGDGSPEGITLVVEPRDADERLVTTAGDIYVAAFEPTATAQEASLGRQFAEWTIPAAEAQQHFRRTSRARGLHFILPWPTTAPATTPIRIAVQLTQFDGSAIETEALAKLNSASGDSH
ncbi:MAG: hypothetical protein MPJ22_04110, partial [Pirellulales bacterium]|nr:hypothetical protein [Pirellulales bacterium]